MIIDAHILTWNEEKFLPYTLLHYTSFCRHVYVYDNKSTDKTRSIVNKFKYASVQSFGTFHFDDKENLKVKNNCWKKSTADFVIVCDCDELLWHPKGLLSQLDKLKASGEVLPDMHGYQVYSETFPEYNFEHPVMPTDMPVQIMRDEMFDKNILFNPRQIDEMNYAPGCHVCSPVGNINDESNFAFRLLHFKYIDRAHIIRRHRTYQKRLSLFNKMNKYGTEYLKGDQYVDAIFNKLSTKAISLNR